MSPMDPVEVKKRHFPHHHPTTARLNHGSFGASPTEVLAKQAEHRMNWLTQPDKAYFFSVEDNINKSCERVAEFIHCSPDEVSLVDNATTAAVVVAQRVQWLFVEGVYEKGKDAVLLLNFCYGAVQKIVTAYLERAGARVVTVNIPFPIESPQEAIDALVKVLEKEKGNIKLAILDHITSMPAMVLPVKEMTRLCHEYGVPEVYVDGAHAIGCVELDMHDIGAEYYSSNLHKWMFCPPGVAFFYCSPKVRDHIHHPIASHNYGTTFKHECAWTGTLDRSPFLCVPEGIDFYEKMGGHEGVMQFNRAELLAKCEMLTKAWGTKLACPPEMVASLAMIHLPSQIKLNNKQEGEDLRHRIRSEFDVETVIHGDNGASYLRLSHQIYNTDEEYDRLRDAILHIAAEYAA